MSNLVERKSLSVDLIIPLYNDAGRVQYFINEITRVIRLMPKEVEIKVIFVNDGSRDNPKEAITKSKFNYKIELIQLSRNFGKEAALTAGITSSFGDACIFLDVDLQDPADLIPKLVDSWLSENVDVVLAIRNPSTGEQGFRRRVSRTYLKFLKKISGIDIHPGAGETRLIDKKVVATLKEFQESQRFMRGLMSWVGYDTSFVYFDRRSSAEKSRFGYRKLIRLALDGIFSFSLTPLRFVTFMGFLTLILSLLLSAFIVYFRLSGNIVLPGFSSTMLVILLTSSIQVLSLGLIGEYLGRTLIESKRRPVFIVMDRRVWEQN